MSCHGWSHPFPPQATLHSSLPFASFLPGSELSLTSMQTTHTCSLHIHAAHTYMQSTCPCNSHAAHKSMQPIHPPSPHIHAVYTCMQPTHPYSPHMHAAHTSMHPSLPSPSSIQFQQLIHHAAVLAKGDRVSVTSSQMCISKHLICEVCTGMDGGGQR